MATLEAILETPFSVIVRDASIQRFKNSSEVVWKAAQQFLKLEHGLIEPNARASYRRLFQLGVIDVPLAAALQETVEDRNRTAHAYIEAVAEGVFARLPIHAKAFAELLCAIDPAASSREG